MLVSSVSDQHLELPKRPVDVNNGGLFLISVRGVTMILMNFLKHFISNGIFVTLSPPNLFPAAHNFEVNFVSADKPCGFTECLIDD